MANQRLGDNPLNKTICDREAHSKAKFKIIQ